jgi:lipoprotein NlpI
MMRAAIRDSRREYDAALRDLSEALRIDPRQADARQMRGTIHFKMSRFKESVQDFDAFLALAPDRRPFHWQRGISLYYAGEFDKGRQQFELHQTVNGNDVENAVWHFLCVARAHDIQTARERVLKLGRDSRVPMTEIYALYSGSGSPEQVMRAASASRSDDALFYGHLYLALYFDATKDLARAREEIRKAVSLNRSHYMGDVARVHATVLNVQP